jgi:hypothetical protein
MINFRYHLVSLVAVFLALAVGIVAGSTVIKESLLDQTESNLDSVTRRLDEVQKNNEKLAAALNATKDRDRQLAELGPDDLLKGRLTAAPILVLALDGVDDGAASDLRRTLGTAGATVAGFVVLESRFALTTPDDIARLQIALGTTEPDPDALRTAVAERLGGLLLDLASMVGTSLAQGSPTTTTTTSDSSASTTTVLPGETTTAPDASTTTTTRRTTTTTILTAAMRESNEVRDLIGALDDKGFVRTTDLADGVDLSGVRVVLLGASGAKVDNTSIINPLLQRLAGATVPTTLMAEIATDTTVDQRGSFVAAVRNDGRLRSRIATVDDAETFAGWAATVLALADLSADHVGHYGVGKGADGLLPAAPS